jgi:hypothetical protein
MTSRVYRSSGLDAALANAARGWRVRPAGPGDRATRATLNSARRTAQHRQIQKQHSPEAEPKMTQHSQQHVTTPNTRALLIPDPSAAREHIRRLREQGGTYRAIAQAAGLSTVTVHDIAADRWQPTPAAVTALLRVRPRTFQQLRIDAGGTRLRLRALHVMGHGSARLARAIGASEKTIRAVVNGDAKTVSIRLRDAVTTVYDQWWDKRAPEGSRAERTAARAARRRAIAGNWCAPAALDDDELDTPGYKPRYGWRPATGTGVAADICPPQRTQIRRGA